MPQFVKTTKVTLQVPQGAMEVLENALRQEGYELVMNPDFDEDDGYDDDDEYEEE